MRRALMLLLHPSVRKYKIKILDLRILYNMNKIEKVYLEGNSISNKDEILSFFNDSKIKFYF